VLGPVVAPAEEVHIAEFGPRLRGGVGLIMGQSDLIGFVQGGQARFVEATERMDQRLRQGEPCADPQLYCRGAVSQPGGDPQGTDTGLDGAGGYGSRAGFHDRFDGDVVGDLAGFMQGFAHCYLHGRTGSHAKLCVQCLGARGELLGGGMIIAGHPV
jgi:hypothetical protein